MKRLIWRASGAAAIGAFALVTTFTLVSAQDAPPAAPAPAEDGAAPPASDAAAPPQAAPAAPSSDPSGCKGLEEKPCRKNTACYWIIPKEPDKSGAVKPPYCHKRGKKKAAAQPAAPADAAAPAEAAPEAAPAPPGPDGMPSP